MPHCFDTINGGKGRLASHSAVRLGKPGIHERHSIGDVQPRSRDTTNILKERLTHDLLYTCDHFVGVSLALGEFVGAELWAATKVVEHHHYGI